MFLSWPPLLFLVIPYYFLWKTFGRNSPLPSFNIPSLMFLAYGWHPPIFSIKNTKFSFCFYILLFIWWWSGKESEDLYTDAQVASHAWFLSTPYFRCHHADVSLTLHLLLIKSHFQISAFFSKSSGKCSLSLLLLYVFSFSFLDSVPIFLNGQTRYQSKVRWP